MVEHLQQHAVKRSRFLRRPLRFAAGQLRRGEDAEQAIAEVVDGRVGDDPLEITLGECGARAHHNGRHREPKQRGERPTHLLREDRQQDAQKPIHSHLRHHARQRHRHARRCLGVRVWQPRVKRYERHFYGET